MSDLIIIIGWYLTGIVSFIISVAVMEHKLTIGNLVGALIVGALGPMILVVWGGVEILSWKSWEKFTISLDKVVWRKKHN